MPINSVRAPRRRVSKIGPDRRRAILDAAQAVVVERGLEGFRVRDVAQRAGIHHATLLHYFPSRVALLQGVVDRIVTQLDRVPLPGSTPVDLTPRQALQQHLEHVYGQTVTYPDRFLALNELVVRASRDRDARAVLEATDTGWLNYLVPLLDSGIRTGEFCAGLDARAAATVIVGFFKGTALQLEVTAAQRRAALNQLFRWIAGDHATLELDHAA